MWRKSFLSLKKSKINKNIYIIGAGGHAFSCIDVIESSGFTIKGIYALEKDINKIILNSHFIFKNV